MKTIIYIALYLCIGIIGGRIAGYRGLVEILTWPVCFPLAMWWNNRKGGE